ncbi:hypothetical protein D3C87_130090 [compost metagenome]
MKKVIFSAAAFMLASTFSFAGTPETKENAKPEANTSSAQIYHYVSNSTAPGAYANTGNWQPGPSPFDDCGTAENRPCEMTANDASDLSSKLSGKSNAQVLAITDSNRP